MLAQTLVQALQLDSETLDGGGGTRAYAVNIASASSPAARLLQLLFVGPSIGWVTSHRVTPQPAPGVDA